jgi:hypothetical protein
LPEASILCSGNTLNEALSLAKTELEKKGQYFKFTPAHVGASTSRSLRPYIKKVVLLLSILFSLYLLLLVSLSSLAVRISDQTYFKYEKKLHRIFNPSDEKQAERLAKFQKNIKKYLPYYKEVKRLLDD